MSRSKKRLLYTGYIILATLFFLYYLFPAEDVKDYLLFHANQVDPHVKVAIEDLEPSFPPGLLLRQITIYYRDKPLFKFEKLKVVPGVLSLVKRQLTAYYNGNLYDGSVQGKVAFPLRKNSRLFAAAELSGINLGSVMALREIIPHRLFGMLSGALTYERVEKNNTVSAESDLQLKECGIEFNTPVYGLDHIDFNEIDAGFVLKGRRLKIERITGAGKDLDAVVSGSVMIRQEMNKSILNVEGEISPQPSLMDRMGRLAHMKNFIKSRSGTRGIGFRLRGTPDNPRFSLK